MPSTVVIDSYLSKYGDQCLYCEGTPCSTCTLSWFPVTQSADGLTVTANITTSNCTAAFGRLETCGLNSMYSECVTWGITYQGQVTLTLAPKTDGTGYHVVDATLPQATMGAISTNRCNSTTYQQAISLIPLSSAPKQAIQDTLLGSEWPCR